MSRGADIDAKDENEETALLVAARNGYTAIVELLVDKGADLETKNVHGKTALRLATKYRHTTTVKLLDRCAHAKAIFFWFSKSANFRVLWKKWLLDLYVHKAMFRRIVVVCRREED